MIERTVLREQVKDVLLQRIVRGELKPGERLVETRIASELGTSQAPVREALRDLELLRMVESEPFRGARVRAFGDEDRQWVTGSVDVKQALYRRRYDVASELLAARAVPEGAPALGEALRFDLKVRAPGTLRIDNNLANLQARADLTLQGTATEPVLVGRAEVDRGRLYFQGQTYVIRRGVIDFT